MRILFFGAGKMVQAMLHRLAPSSHQFYFYSPSGVSAQAAAQLCNGKVISSLNELPEVDAYVLGCKPQQFHDLAHELMGKLIPGATVLSILAAVNTSTIVAALKMNHIIRIMPNTPVEVGKGVIPLFFSPAVSEAAKSSWHHLLSALGMILTLDREEKIELLTPFSGSGPGFIFEWARLWQIELNQLGFSEDLSRSVVAQTFLGAGQLMCHHDVSFEQMRNDVTSKAGITAAGLKAMEEAHFYKHTKMLFDEAFKRQRELTDAVGNKG